MSYCCAAEKCGPLTGVSALGALCGGYAYGLLKQNCFRIDCRSMCETAEISLTRSFQIHGPAGRKVVPTKVNNLTVGTNGAFGNRVLADRVYTAIRTSSPRCRGVTYIRSRTRNQWRQTIEGVDDNREIPADKSSEQTHSKPTGVRWRCDRRSLKGTLQP